MKKIAFIGVAALLPLFTGCGGAPGTSSSSQSEAAMISSEAVISSSVKSSSSLVASSSVASSVISSSVAPSSSAMSVASSSIAASSSSSTANVFVIPNATNGARPYCRSDASDADQNGVKDGWGWENAASCIVYGSAADPGVGNFNYCVVGAEQTPLCAIDSGSWGFENSEICLSRSMCPGMGSGVQAPIRDDLTNASANAKTQKVFDYLKSQWGNHMISGQMDLTWDDSVDMVQRVMNDTGKSPALMGYDFMNYGIDNQYLGGLKQTEEAIAYWNKGGLISLTWHWRDPNTSGSTIGEFYTKSTSFQIPIANKQLDLNSTAFKNMINDIDMVAGELKKLQSAGVPVIWRPLHEASGGWFWWGRSDRTDGIPPSYAQVLLWRYMYDRLTTFHGLNNLIWEWNGQSASWYPGDDYVDITSYDVYAPARDYGSQVGIYNETKAYSQEVKMVAMSENSNIPDPDKMKADGAWWLYFMVWNDGNVAVPEGTSDVNNFWTGEYYNTNAHKRHVYSHNLVITLDELPKF